MSTLRVNNMTDVSGNGPTYAKGMVIQTVKNKTASTPWNTTTVNAWVATPLTMTITPKSANSTILVLVTGSLYQAVGAKNTWWTTFRGTTAGTNLGDSNYGMGLMYSPNDISAPLVASVVDTPGTTSAVTYTFAVKTATGGNVYFPLNAADCHITLQEIAG